jgi:uncharacterized protein (DUF342 family)
MTDDERKRLAAEGYTIDQIDEIRLGEDAGLDVSVYEDKDYFAIQMRQIRQGLLDGVDVSRYADPKFDWFQMEEIRKGLLSGVDVDKYGSLTVSYDRMRQVRIGLEQGIDLSKYIKLSAGIICQVREAFIAKVNISDYIKDGYDPEQLEEIRTFLAKGVSAKEYLSVEYRALAIRQICQGIEMGLDVSVYAKTYLNWRQMQEIRIGLETRINVSEYENPLYSWQQMREIRLGLEEGLDVSLYKSFMYTAADMKEKRLLLEKRVATDAAAIYGEHGGNAFPESLSFDDFTISVAKDEMEAYVTVHGNTPMPIKKSEIMKALRQEGVSFGIDEDVVDNLVNGSYNELTLKVARGQKPVDGADGWYELFFRTNVERTPKLLPDNSVDYQNIEWFEVVKKGQKIAFYHAASEGTAGRNIRGAVLPARKGKEQRVLAGRGFAVEPDGRTYTALTDGRIEFVGGRIDISKVLVVDDSAVSNCNINFDGSVYIKGNVGNGIRIEATENIIIEGHVEGATIECGGDVFIQKGMNAGGEGYVRSAGSIVGRYFEYARIHASKDIKADYFLGCQIYAEGQIQAAGVKGSIMGGTGCAIAGITADSIGNHAGIATFLKLGINDSIINQMKSIDGSIAAVDEELKILKNAHAELTKKYPSEMRNTMEIYLKVENAIYTKEMESKKLQESKRQLEEDMAKMQEGRIVVNNTLYEGVVMELNGVRWNSKEVKSVTIKNVGKRVAVYSIN